uniref:Uncharacterized protein n=1 Tax=Oryza brachyantha TaxID=4533 RepID=J3LWH4_ORYBR
MATAGGCGGSVRMMVSYRGEIVQGDHGPGGGRAKAAPYYAGGVHRVVKVALSERLAGLRAGGMRRSVSSPELMTPPSGSNNMATLTPTAAAAPGDSAGSKDDMAGPVPAQLVAPVVWVPVTSAATVVIPVYYYPVDYPRVVLN